MTGKFIVRAGKALAVYIVFGLILLGVSYYITRSFDDASQQLRAQFENAPDPTLSVMLLVEAARYELMQWLVLSCLGGWICASLFLFQAEGHQPSSVAEGRQRLVNWIVLFLVAVSCLTGVWYVMISLKGVAAVLLADGYLLALAFAFILIPLAFWVATGLCVKGVMRPSVPLSGLLPRFWS